RQGQFEEVPAVGPTLARGRLFAVVRHGEVSSGNQSPTLLSPGPNLPGTGPGGNTMEETQMDCQLVIRAAGRGVSPSGGSSPGQIGRGKLEKLPRVRYNGRIREFARTPLLGLFW